MSYQIKLSLIFFGLAKYDCVVKTREMFNFLPQTIIHVLLD